MKTNRNKFWLVYSINMGAMEFESLIAAKEAAEVYAQDDPGAEVFILVPTHVVEAVEQTNIEWENL